MMVLEPVLKPTLETGEWPVLSETREPMDECKCGSGRPIYSRGVCSRCYTRLRKAEKAEKKTVELVEPAEPDDSVELVEPVEIDIEEPVRRRPRRNGMTMCGWCLVGQCGPSTIEETSPADEETTTTVEIFGCSAERGFGKCSCQEAGHAKVGSTSPSRKFEDSAKPRRVTWPMTVE